MGLLGFFTLKFHSVSKTHPASDLHMWLLNNTLVADVFFFFFFFFVFLPNHTPKKRWLHISLNSTTPGLLIYAVLVEIKTQNKCCGAISPEIKNPFPNLLILPSPLTRPSLVHCLRSASSLIRIQTNSDLPYDQKFMQGGLQFHKL